MVRRAILGLTFLLAAMPAGAGAQTKTMTWTGWFSDKGCATGRVAAGDISPNGVACAKKCLNEGATPVFISEQAKALFEVLDHPKVIDDVGYHVEITADVDEKAKTVSVKSVKRLSEVVQMCALPKKGEKK